VSKPVNAEAMTQRGKQAYDIGAAGMLGFADSQPSLGGAMPSGPQTILLVEDEAFVREVAAQVLKSAGYTVLIAKNAAEGRATYDQFSNQVDLLLSDVILPDENGRTLAQYLRSRNVRLPVLLITGYVDQPEGMNSGLSGVECLPKPFSARTLLEKIRAMLDKEQWREGWHPITHACGIE
jgi:DNA-binding response OmpR family regulator